MKSNPVEECIGLELLRHPYRISNKVGHSRETLFSAVNLHATYASLNSRWEEVCRRYLNVAAEDSVWRYSRCSRSYVPTQGWKLHLSATILNASDVLEAVGPLLLGQGVLFKAPHSLLVVSNLNSGIHYGYHQVGKIITVYPQNEKMATSLARELHKRTQDFVAPSVPFDLKFRKGSCIHFRYGSFISRTMTSPEGIQLFALCDPGGKLVPDDRASVNAKPDWIPDLFPCRNGNRKRTSKIKDDGNPLATTYRVFDVLSQRGKGGIYKAIDLSVSPPRVCILKEGRRHGETGWDGRDGFWRVEHETKVIAGLRNDGVNVPMVYSSFKAEKNFFLAMELIEGETLERFLLKRRRRLSLSDALHYGLQLAGIMERIHDAGWVWRDCKPLNLLVTKHKELRPIDFEGACARDRPERIPWGTPCFAAPEWCDESNRIRLPEDLYGLGAMIHYLIAGTPANLAPSLSIRSLRRNTPHAVATLIEELLNSNPAKRPSAKIAAERLRLALLEANSRSSMKLKRSA